MKGGLQALLVPVILLLLLGAAHGSSENSGARDRCEALVRKWAEQEIWAMEEADSDSDSSLDANNKWELQDLLFFLHIPRTGGRNYNQCFLKNLFVQDQLCPRSYDKLRIEDLSKPNCSLLSTHDDYSILTRLPKARTSIITNMRDPTSRVLSAYEFSVEVAARFLKRPRSLLRRPPPGPKMAGMSTLDIWPWKYLVPLLQEDLFLRRDLRKVAGFDSSQSAAGSTNVYDVPSFAMPLKEFIEHPTVHELVHNGATFQVAGITNNSYLEDANEIRYCVAKYEDLGDHVLRVAKRRLDGMLYVGLTEKHRESAEVFVHLVGRQVATKNFQDNVTRISSPDDSQGNESIVVAANDTSYEEFINQMVTSYQRCSNTLRNAQVSRRVNSLELITPVNFSKEARKTIPEDVMARILQLNSLDFELYQHAKKLLEVEQEYLKNHAEELKKYHLERRAKLVTAEDQQQQDVRLMAGVLEASACYVIGCSIVVTALGIYILVKFFFRRERARAATHILHQSRKK